MEKNFKVIKFFPLSSFLLYKLEKAAIFFNFEQQNKWFIISGFNIFNLDNIVNVWSENIKHMGLLSSFKKIKPIEEMRHEIVDILTMKSQEKVKFGKFAFFIFFR